MYTVLVTFLLIVISLAAIIWYSFLIRDSFVNSVPFVSVRRRAIAPIIDVLQLGEKSILFDLGCGDGRILIAALQAKPGITAIGIERGILPFVIAKIRSHFYPFELKFDSILTTDLRDVTHIYTYLSDDLMSQLKPKILAECKKGTRIVSCDFIFPEWQPVQTIIMNTSKYALSKKLYVYMI